ncbi:MAG: tripartite tricarboxylate transporter TctB family protein [Cardiobacteriaceae bacterium]|nr:tripartite tricarboxylate transporter TctB family protein [Cardiobacteriaceae bacterium]
MNEDSRMPGRQAQMVFALLLLCFSALVAWEAWRIEGWPQWSSPGAFPLALAGVMIVSALVIARNAWRSSARRAFRPYVSARWCAMLGLVLGFVLLLDVAGFWLAGTLFLTLAIVFLQRGRPAFAAAVALATTALVYGVFNVLFRVQLP